MPYTKADLYTVDRPAGTELSGNLQPGDVILSFNGHPFYRCMYFLDSPIYGAPRGKPIPVEYRRPSTGARGITTVLLEDPSPRLTFNRSATYLIALSFVLTSVIILLGASANQTTLLVGLAGLTGGLVVAASQDIGDFQAPLSLFFWWGRPVWAVLAVAAHAVWPVRQIHRPHVRRLLAGAVLVSSVHLVLTVAGATWFGCYKQRWALGLASWADFINLGLPFLSVLYLLGSASRTTSNPFTRLQIQAILWAVGLGLGTPFVLSLMPQAIGLPWVAPIEITVLVSGIIPITYLFVFYRGELLVVSRFLNRGVFTVLYLVFWWVVALLVVNGVAYWFPNPDLTLIAFLAALPPLLAATILRERLGLLVDLALHGIHYDYEAVVSRIGPALAGVLQEEGLVDIIIRQLPQALAIRHASLWLAEDADQMRLVGHSSESQQMNLGRTAPLGEFPRGEVSVDVLPSTFETEHDPTAWRTIVRLHDGGHLKGFVLLGEKIREHVYTDKDLRTLQTLAGWMATTVANIGYLEEQRTAGERGRALMLALVENEEEIRAQVAGELHDRGITSLGMVRLMVEQGRSRVLVNAGLERVISDLRELSNNHLSPAGLEQGLPQALEAMVESQRQLGVPVSLAVSDPRPSSHPPSPLISRELFYIAQEAVVNAARHAEAKRITVRLEWPEGVVRLEVDDDGKGFAITPPTREENTRGLGIMRARASRIGGRLSFSSNSTAGTVVSVEVDLELGRGS